MSATTAPTNVGQEEDDKRNEYAFHWNAHMKSTAALCLCIASMSYMIISVFPYSGFMAIEPVNGVTEETTGTYAGLLASSFMVGRALTSYAWGKWADIYGRVFVLQLSLALSAVLNLAFGMAPSYGAAIATRFLLGVSNGIMSTAKTAVTELAYGNAQLEKRGMGLVVGTWGWAYLWAPAIGGFLAEPAKHYSNSSFIQNTHIFTQFPFLLPNLVGMLVCVLAMLSVHAWVPETLAQDKRRSPRQIPHDAMIWTRGLKDKAMACACCRRGTYEEERQLVQESPSIAALDDADDWTYNENDDIPSLQIKRSESGNMLSTQFNEISPRPSVIHVKPSVAKRLSRISAISIESIVTPRQKRSSSLVSATIQSLWDRVDTRVHLMLYWLFGFVQVTGDEAFPLYCISKQGGLGLTESSIGKILSVSGLIFGICQYFVYASIVNRLGLYESMVIGSLCLPFLAFIPFATTFGFRQEDGSEQVLSWGGFTFLCFVLATSRIFSSVYFSSIFIALNRTVPTSHRATMNGLQTLGGSISKGLGPTFAGLLVSFSLSSGGRPTRATQPTGTSKIVC